MNINKDQQQQQQQQQQRTMKKNMKKNKRQYYQNVQQHIKRKYKRLGMKVKAIPNRKRKIHYQQSEMIQNAELKTTSVSQSSIMKTRKYFPLNIDLNTDPTQFLFDYSIITNMIFKEMFFKIIVIFVTDPNKIDLMNVLNNENILTFIRQLAQFMNKKNYTQLQLEQWTYYFHLGMTEGIWVGRVSTTMATVNSMCQTYGRSKIVIEQRQKKYQQQLEQIQNDINEYLKQAPALIDINKIITLINHLIHQDQSSLRLEFERRKDMLKFDAQEHQYVHVFYNLKPRPSEIHSAKIIWKAIQDEQLLRYEIALFQKWFSIKSLQPTCNFEDLQLNTISNIFTQLMFDQQGITSIHQQCDIPNIINKLKNDLTEQTVLKAEELAQTYVQKVIDEKNKLFKTKEKLETQTVFDHIVKAIENRITNMIQRAEYDTKQKLKLIFHENNQQENNNNNNNNNNK